MILKCLECKKFFTIRKQISFLICQDHKGLKSEAET